MALRSRMFSGRKVFENCLVSDPAHITPGSAGDHVTSIQIALQFLGDVRISEGELASTKYGPTTAAAVLAYKKKRKIINRSYQTTEDNIVGKMTIASLDEDMIAIETRLEFALRPTSLIPHPDTPDEPPPAVAARPPAAPALGIRGNAVGGPVRAPGGPATGFLASLPQDLRDAIDRSNNAKIPGDDMLLPFISNERTGPISNEELSAAFERFQTARQTLKDVYDRCKQFDLWRHVKLIHETFPGDGAKGIKAILFDDAAAEKHCDKLSETFGSIVPVIIYTPGFAPIVQNARLCKDIFNVHGERDSWRETRVLPLASGLHFCIPTPKVRGNGTRDQRADIHIDTFQQSQVQASGHCIPLLGPSTTAHVISVAPYLARCASEQVDKIMSKVPKTIKPSLPF